MPRGSYIILPLLLASIMASMGMPASAFYNLLRNPGFETGELGPWEAEVVSDGKAEIRPPGRTDNYAAFVESGAWGARIWQDIDPPRCAEYLEFWYIYGRGTATIYYSDGTVDGNWLLYTDVWTPVHVDLDNTKLVARVEVSAWVSYVIYFDDFDLEACVDLPVGGELTQSMTPVPNPLMVIAVIAAASAVVLGYRFAKSSSITLSIHYSSLHSRC